MAQSANVEMPASNRMNLSLTALAGWLLVLPATFFLAAAALRTLQPRQFQPARACWAIFEWVATHFTHLDAAVVFLALPIIALAAGGAALWREWRGNTALRRDAATAVALVRRQFGTLCLVATLLAAGGVLTFVVDHLMVG
jgi:hypothetical protein